MFIRDSGCNGRDFPMKEYGKTFCRHVEKHYLCNRNRDKRSRWRDKTTYSRTNNKRIGDYHYEEDLDKNAGNGTGGHAQHVARQLRLGR